MSGVVHFLTPDGEDHPWGVQAVPREGEIVYLYAKPWRTELVRHVFDARRQERHRIDVRLVDLAPGPVSVTPPEQRDTSPTSAAEEENSNR